MSLWQNLTIIKQYLTIIKESAESASSEKWLKNMVNFAKSGAARTSTPDHHPWALRGQYTPPPRGGTGAGDRMRVLFFFQGIVYTLWCSPQKDGFRNPQIITKQAVDLPNLLGFSLIRH